MINPHLVEKRAIFNSIVNIRRDGFQTIISIGGTKDDAKRFSKMAANMAKRDQFYKSLIKFLFKWNCNGILLDWEYPTPEDRDNFVNLLKELKIILQDHHVLLLVAVSARMDDATLRSYDIPQIAKHADFIILNTHDNQDPYGPKIDYISPLYGNGSRSVERGVRHWVEQSKISEKLILGIPLFAQTFTLKDASNTVVGAPSKGPGRQHDLSGQEGFMTYAEFCAQAAKWEKKYDKQAQVPYAYKNGQWITYENGQSISAKMRLAKEQRLGGAMMWSIDADDFYGICGEHYGLLKVVLSIIGSPDIFTTQAPTTEGVGLCPKQGLFRHKWNCQAYYECRDGRRTSYECLKGEFFNEELGQCKPSAEVKCNQNFVTWRPGQRGYNFHDLPLNLKVLE
ncbi:probable chitinase 10 isoform X2 [Drosophila montana]